MAVEVKLVLTGTALATDEVALLEMGLALTDIAGAVFGVDLLDQPVGDQPFGPLQPTMRPLDLLYDVPWFFHSPPHS
ncbi:MAG: hypothetical protein QXT73_06850 [Candidatus Methanomethylicaceae archaeon]